MLVSCEHGGNDVPPAYAALFSGAERVLDSHRGMDFGARDVALAFGARLGVTPAIGSVTRLVVDLNRSPQHRNVFSEYTRGLSRGDKRAALDAHYWPYRKQVERRVERAVRSGAFVLHVSAHSFTPELKGEVRNCDVGLLYDPGSSTERRFIEAWHAALEVHAPALRVRRNYPYRGVSDSLVTHLRRVHRERMYAGVELEVNQKHVGTPGWRALVATLAKALEHALAD
ncbi:MAG TPA: N-formylglutamate amidohydrolase [Gammaproteobacteria bacterium]|nr:N-formylglutamate amidohydrolase [Gammaproteobacteria bacterium]